ncbi:MAG: Bacterial type secretion system protein [Candidatus Aminicenantes bacterium]|nr:Bacterial type secretion system protein [Candidatus Aminicenantes bacterium]
MKLLKILSRIGVVLLIIVAAVLVIRAVFNYMEGRALNRALAGLKAQGLALTARDLTTPCPDQDNAARLMKASENISAIPGRRTAGPGQRDPGDQVRGLIARSWNDYTAGKPLAPADRAELKDVIHDNAKAFELLTEMGNKPCFLYRDPAQSLLESRPPDAIQMIQTTKLLLFSALFSAEDGDIHSAVDKLATGLKFTPITAREGTLIAFLISLAETRFLSQPLGDICRGRALGDEDLGRLMGAQDPGPWRHGLANAFRGERVMYVEVGEDILKGSFSDLGSIWEGQHWWEKLGLWLLRPLVKRDLRQTLPGFEFLEAQTRIPYYQSRDALRARDRGLQEKPWYAFPSKMMIYDSEAAFLKVAQIEAIMLANRAGLACRLYKSRTGTYPASLEELVPGLLNEVPVDPFTGKPFVYRREGEGFIVYSLGSNEKDDGGRSTYMITQLVMEKDDDWTWREEK